MRVRFFGRLRDSIGDALEADFPPGLDSEGARAWLGERYPALLDPRVRIAVDDRMLAGAEDIAAARELCFLPPVSGG